MTEVIGIDVGSSSIKATLFDCESGRVLASATSPDVEMPIQADEVGWAEQDPELWWHHTKAALAKIISQIGVSRVQAIGISYQMHGLVMVGADKRPLRPAIIWCDSRAVAQGEQISSKVGGTWCAEHLMNLPGNFTLSKLLWVAENQPEILARCVAFMLPGDYIALKLSGEISSTPSGLSEGTLWDIVANQPAWHLIDALGLARDLVPQRVSTFTTEITVSKEGAKESGLPYGIPISYRAGDQPNNALSLNALESGEIAATAGTSAVIYAVHENPIMDLKGRINSFLHVNHTESTKRYGSLLCVNGAGALNSWLRKILSANSEQSPLPYDQLNSLANEVPPGSDGLRVFPYGNGAERTLRNLNIGASIEGLSFNRHSIPQLSRAVQESIVFALRYGLDAMQENKIPISAIRAGHANMFLSPVFREIFAAVTNSPLQLFDTDGSQGAARGAAVGANIFQSFKEAFESLRPIVEITPNREISNRYEEIYGAWSQVVSDRLKTR